MIAALGRGGAVVHTHPGHVRRRDVPRRHGNTPARGHALAIRGGQSFRCYREGVARPIPCGRPDGRSSASRAMPDIRSTTPGRPMGIIAALSRRPIADPDLAESMMKIFAARAAAEIERTRAEEALRRERGAVPRSYSNARARRAGPLGLGFPPRRRQTGIRAQCTLDARRCDRPAYDHPAYPPRLRAPAARTGAAAPSPARPAMPSSRPSARAASALPPDGTTIPFLHRGEPHVLAIARDITERASAGRGVCRRDSKPSSGRPRRWRRSAS